VIDGRDLRLSAPLNRRWAGSRSCRRKPRASGDAVPSLGEAIAAADAADVVVPLGDHMGDSPAVAGADDGQDEIIAARSFAQY